MSRISSLTETTGVRSPQRCGAGVVTGAAFDEEHADANAATVRTPQTTSGLRVRTTDTCAPWLSSIAGSRDRPYVQRISQRSGRDPYSGLGSGPRSIDA